LLFVLVEVAEEREVSADGRVEVIERRSWNRQGADVVEVDLACLADA